MSPKALSGPTAIDTLLKRAGRRNALVVATGAIFLGGIGRLISIAAVGAPSRATWFVLIIELGAVALALAMRRRIQPEPSAGT